MAAVGQPLPPEAKGQARSAMLTRACFLVGTLKENEQKCGWRWTQPLQEPAGSRGRGKISCGSNTLDSLSLGLQTLALASHWQNPVGLHRAGEANSRVPFPSAQDREEKSGKRISRCEQRQTLRGPLKRHFFPLALGIVPRNHSQNHH